LTIGLKRSNRKSGKNKNGKRGTVKALCQLFVCEILSICLTGFYFRPRALPTFHFPRFLYGNRESNLIRRNFRNIGFSVFPLFADVALHAFISSFFPLFLHLSKTQVNQPSERKAFP